MVQNNISGQFSFHGSMYLPLFFPFAGGLVKDRVVSHAVGVSRQHWQFFSFISENSITDSDFLVAVCVLFFFSPLADYANQASEVVGFSQLYSSRGSRYVCRSDSFCN